MTAITNTGDAVTHDAFPGFSQATLSFLRDLAANNDRDWFKAHRDDFEEHVLTPMRRLVGVLAPAMLAIDPGLEVDPRRGVISRLYRDTRFSRDKSPYRTNQWIVFKRPGRDWTTRPAFFLEFDADRYRYGMGYYAAAPAAMAAVREHIGRRLTAYEWAMASAVQAGFVIAGDEYKRHRDGVAWLRRKNPYLVVERPVDCAAAGPLLAPELSVAFAAAAPLYAFLMDAPATHSS